MVANVHLQLEMLIVIRLRYRPSVRERGFATIEVAVELDGRSLRQSLCDRTPRGLSYVTAMVHIRLQGVFVFVKSTPAAFDVLFR